MQLETSDILGIKTNAITFSLIAKYLLPKEEVEKIDIIMNQLALGDIEPQDMLKLVGNIMKNYHAVNKVWQALTDRQSIRMSPLYTLISQTTRTLLEARVPEYYIISFFSTMILQASHNVRNIDLISLILSYRFLKKYHDVPVNYLLVNGLKVASRIKPIKEKINLRPVFNVYSIVKSAEYERPSPPSIRYKPNQIKQSTSNIAFSDSEFTLGYSYQKTRFYISPLPSMFIVNTYAKSTRVGSEGGISTKVSDFERFYNFLITYAHSLFENFVIADISTYSLARLGHCSNLLLRNIIEDLYQSEKLTILKYVERTNNFKILKKRVHQQIVNYAQYRYHVEEKVSFFTDSYPVFDVNLFNRFSRQNSIVEIDFDINRQNTALIVWELCTNYLPLVATFINNTLPYFSARENEKIMIITSDPVANALYYFSLACSELETLLLPPQEDESSIRSIIDSAVFEIESKYMNVINSELYGFLESFFQKFVRNSSEIYNLIDEAVSKFGRKTPSLFKFVFNLEKIRNALEKFTLDQNRNKFMKLTRFYAKASEPFASEKLEARLPFMVNKLGPISMITGLVKVEIDGKTKKMKITPTCL